MAMSESQEAQALAASLRRLPLGHIPAAGLRSDHLSDRHSGAPYSTGPVSWTDETLGQNSRAVRGGLTVPAKPTLFSRPSTTPAAFAPRNTVAAALGGSASPTAWSTWRQEASEAHYPGKSKEILGKPATRGHVLPVGLGSQTAFGRSSDMEHARAEAEQTFRPRQPLESPEHREHSAHGMYIKSHGAWDAGESVNRHYNWPAGLDPKSHTFGKSAAGRSAAQESPELQDTLVEHYNIEPSCEATRRRQAFHDQHADHLGRPRHLACADRSLPTDFAYGGRAGHSRPSTAGAATAAQGQQLGVSGALQHSLYSGPRAADSGAQYSADAGLGSSLHEGWRNGAADPDRVFGVPSLRTDKVPPQQPSVAGRDDYGNAATMDQVMKPRRQNQVADGLMTQRGPQEIRNLCEDSGLSTDNFAVLFKEAAARDGQADTCSMSSYLQAKRFHC